MSRQPNTPAARALATVNAGPRPQVRPALKMLLCAAWGVAFWEALAWAVTHAR